MILPNTPSKLKPHTFQSVLITRDSWSVQRVGQRHADLSHAVALQQDMTRDLLPTLQDRLRERSRTRHHQPAVRHKWNRFFFFFYKNSMFFVPLVPLQFSHLTLLLIQLHLTLQNFLETSHFLLSPFSVLIIEAVTAQKFIKVVPSPVSHSFLFIIVNKPENLMLLWKQDCPVAWKLPSYVKTYWPWLWDGHGRLLLRMLKKMSLYKIIIIFNNYHIDDYT